nr:hypothetical protein [Tanacetum cinerariifolium]
MCGLGRSIIYVIISPQSRRRGRGQNLGHDERVFSTVANWRVSAPKDELPAEDTYSLEAVAVLNTHRTPIQKQPQALLCLVGLSQRYFLGDDVYPIFLHDDDRDMDFFNLIRASNPTKVKIGTRPRAAHEVPLLTVIAIRETPVDVSDPYPLSFANLQSIPKQDVIQSSKGAAVAGDLESENARENKIKNLEALLEAETDMKNAAKANNAELVKELENLRAQFTDLQVSNDRLSQQVSTLQALVTGEEKIKATFKEFKKYEDDRVEKRCVEINARLDALSIDFDDELYPHKLTTIAGCRWVVGHGLRLAVMKCVESTKLRQGSERIKYGVEDGKANLDLEAIEAYDPKADTKYVVDLHALRDLKYPMVDQLESLKDAPIDVIMASLHLEKVRDLKDPWSFKEEILLKDAIVANVSRAKKKKKCQVVCRTHRVGSAHHARSDGDPVLVPTVAPQGLAILLADATTQMETSENGASMRFLRSKSLLGMYNLDWP